MDKNEEREKEKFGAVAEHIKKVHGLLDQVGADIDTLKYQVKVSSFTESVPEPHCRSESRSTVEFLDLKKPIIADQSEHTLWSPKPRRKKYKRSNTKLLYSGDQAEFKELPTSTPDILPHFGAGEPSQIIGKQKSCFSSKKLEKMEYENTSFDSELKHMKDHSTFHEDAGCNMPDDLGKSSLKCMDSAINFYCLTDASDTSTPRNSPTRCLHHSVMFSENFKKRRSPRNRYLEAWLSAASTAASEKPLKVDVPNLKPTQFANQNASIASNQDPCVPLDLSEEEEEDYYDVEADVDRPPSVCSSVAASETSSWLHESEVIHRDIDSPLELSEDDELDQYMLNSVSPFVFSSLKEIPLFDLEPTFNIGTGSKEATSIQTEKSANAYKDVRSIRTDIVLSKSPRFISLPYSKPTPRSKARCGFKSQRRRLKLSRRKGTTAVPKRSQNFEFDIFADGCDDEFKGSKESADSHLSCINRTSDSNTATDFKLVETGSKTAPKSRTFDSKYHINCNQEPKLLSAQLDENSDASYDSFESFSRPAKTSEESHCEFKEEEIVPTLVDACSKINPKNKFLKDLQNVCGIMYEKEETTFFSDLEQSYLNTTQMQSQYQKIEDSKSLETRYQVQQKYINDNSFCSNKELTKSTTSDIEPKLQVTEKKLALRSSQSTSNIDTENESFQHNTVMSATSSESFESFQAIKKLTGAHVIEIVDCLKQSHSETSLVWQRPKIPLHRISPSIKPLIDEFEERYKAVLFKKKPMLMCEFIDNFVNDLIKNQSEKLTNELITIEEIPETVELHRPRSAISKIEVLSVTEFSGNFGLRKALTKVQKIGYCLRKVSKFWEISDCVFPVVFNFWRKFYEEGLPVASQLISFQIAKTSRGSMNTPEENELALVPKSRDSSDSFQRLSLRQRIFAVANVAQNAGRRSPKPAFRFAMNVLYNAGVNVASLLFLWYIFQTIADDYLDQNEMFSNGILSFSRLPNHKNVQ